MKGSHSLLLPKGVCARRLQSRSVLWWGGGREGGRVKCCKCCIDEKGARF